MTYKKCEMSARITTYFCDSNGNCQINLKDIILIKSILKPDLGKHQYQ